MSNPTTTRKRFPIFAIIGLFILLGSVGWAVFTMRESLRTSPEFGGFAGFGVLMILMITIPLSFVFGVVGLCRGEHPKFIPWTATILSLVPILIMIVELVITRNA